MLLVVQDLSGRADARAQLREEFVARAKEDGIQKRSSSRRRQARIHPRDSSVHQGKAGNFQQELTVDLPMVVQHYGIHVRFGRDRQVGRQVERPGNGVTSTFISRVASASAT